MTHEYTRFDVNIPSNVEDYLRKNATQLLDGDSDYAIDVFKKLMDYPNDMEFSEDEKAIFSALLEHYEEQGKFGHLTVLDGGLSDRGLEIFNAFEEPEELPEIRGVISDIEIFPDEYPLIVQWEAQNGDMYTVQTLAQYRLDGRKYMVGYVKEVDAISHFGMTTEGEYTILEPIVDETLFELCSQIWNRLKILKAEAEKNVQ